jgi:hypothetical protein
MKISRKDLRALVEAVVAVPGEDYVQDETGYAKISGDVAKSGENMGVSGAKKTRKVGEPQKKLRSIKLRAQNLVLNFSKGKKLSFSGMFKIGRNSINITRTRGLDSKEEKKIVRELEKHMREDAELKDLRKETLRVGRPAVFTLGVKAAPPPTDRKQTDGPTQTQTATPDDETKSKASKIYYFNSKTKGAGTAQENDGFKYRVGSDGSWEASSIKKHGGKFYSLKSPKFKDSVELLDKAHPGVRKTTKSESTGMSHGTMIRNRYGRY